jgi:hypothetical protein
MSPKPPASKPGCPPPRPTFENGLASARSYSLRLSGSPRTSCASEISLKRASDFASPGFLSGWYLRASLRYAFLISSADALRSTPSTL